LSRITPAGGNAELPEHIQNDGEPDMNSPPRVAFFTDTYDEINGVALTSRQLEAFARRHGYPFLCVRGCNETQLTDGALVLKRGRMSFGLDRGLMHDPFLWRHYGRVRAAVKDFRPDIIHIVSPGDVSGLGLAMAWNLKVPLVMSWHTNLHEFGEMRLRRSLEWLPGAVRDGICGVSVRLMLAIAIGFYRFGRVLYAPNQELVEMLERRTGRPTRLMTRGIDTALFNPSKRPASDGIFRLGFVGRITPEKSVRLFARVERALLERGITSFRFLIVGDGSEREWLRSNLRHVDLPGILRGEELAAAYAAMDLFLFPSRTDTFGNVVQEAMASGAPSIVTDLGGPKFIVRDGVTGCVTHCDDEFIARTIDLIEDRERLARMRTAGLEQAARASWDRVFEGVYAGYLEAGRANPRPSSPALRCEDSLRAGGR
jgi:phosphatidylinositol alpha 1,6-mannosyltransferase